MGIRDIFRKFLKIRFVGFGLVGLSGTVIDLGVFTLLTCVFSEIALKIIIQNIFLVVAFVLSVINNYLWSYFWVWKDRERAFFKNFIKYFASTIIAFLIRFAIFNGILRIINADNLFFHKWLESFNIKQLQTFRDYLVYYSIYCFAFLIAMIVNFILIDKKVFKNNQLETEK